MHYPTLEKRKLRLKEVTQQSKTLSNLTYLTPVRFPCCCPTGEKRLWQESSCLWDFIPPMRSTFLEDVPYGPKPSPISRPYT